MTSGSFPLYLLSPPCLPLIPRPSRAPSSNCSDYSRLSHQACAVPPRPPGSQMLEWRAEGAAQYVYTLESEIQARPPLRRAAPLPIAIALGRCFSRFSTIRCRSFTNSCNFRQRKYNHEIRNMRFRVLCVTLDV